MARNPPSPRLLQASPGDMLVRGASSWQIPPHRTIINAIDEFQVDPTGATNSSDRMQAAVDAAGAITLRRIS